MIKKLSVVILAALLLVSLSSCGKKDQPAKSDLPKAEETKADHPKAEETKADHPKAEETKSENPTPDHPSK